MQKITVDDKIHHVNIKSMLQGFVYTHFIFTGTDNLLIDRTVIYDVMGGAFFIEDGIETGIVMQFNLAIFVRQSTSLLNDDVTPGLLRFLSFKIYNNLKSNLLLPELFFVKSLFKSYVVKYLVLQQKKFRK